MADASDMPSGLIGAARPARTAARRLGSALVVAGVALVVQLVYLAEGYCSAAPARGGAGAGYARESSDPSFLVPVVDAGVYHDAAVRFAAGGSLADGPFWQPPLFPLLLGILYRTVGVSIVAAKLLLAGIAVANCVLLLHLGARTFTPRVGLVAGLILAVYGPFVFLSTQLLPTGLATFWGLLGLVLWLGCLECPRWWRWLALGAVAGAGAATVPNAGLLLVVAVAGEFGRAVLGRRREPCLQGAPDGTPLPLGGEGRVRGDVVVARPSPDPSLRGRGAGSGTPSVPCLCLGMALVIAPIAVRNYAVSRQFVLISTNGGINFYVGNNPDADRTVAIRPGEYWQRLTRSFLVEGNMTAGGMDRYFLRQALAYLRDDPLGFLRGLARKTLQLVNAREVPRNVDAYVYRDFSHLLSVLLWRAGPFGFPLGVVGPLAVIGVVVSRRVAIASGVNFRWGLLAYAAVYGLSVVAFFVSARHRLPLMPVVVLFAAVGVVWVAQGFAGRLRTPSPCPLPQRGRGAYERVPGPQAIAGSDGVGAGSDGAGAGSDGGLAVRVGIAFAVAAVVINWPITTSTDHVNFRAELEMSVGARYATTGRFAEAERHLQRALALDSDYAAARTQLAQVYARQGRFDPAADHFRQAMALDPDSAEARYLYGDLLRRQDHLPEAIAAYREALTRDPFSPEAHAGLAEALLTADRPAEAVPHYRFALELLPPSGQLRVHLGDALARQGEYEGALEQYRAGLWQFEPDAATVQRVAWLLATCPQENLRDGPVALDLALHLCHLTGENDAVSLDTLAAAYAACGRWQEAVSTAQRALDLARNQGHSDLAAAIEGRLHGYQAGASRQ
ncbi:MAG TPA: tetratricopeptide repeat protein [Phycisphaerae bacterium]|nr:tetratricopeptide repeat protein [Phycisphaerae bacterium]HNU45742.1 tetratricopeptide repeat protein [Phycisphaerae bacterium]